MLIKYFFLGLATVIGSATASIIVLSVQGRIAGKQTKDVAKSWILILFLFSLTVAGLFLANAYDWEKISLMHNLVNFRIPSISDREVTVGLYPLPVLTSMLLSLLLFFVISITKSLTATLKINPAQTDKRLQDFLHFKELLYSAMSIFLLKIIIYYSSVGFELNALISSLGLLLTIGLLFYEILRWIHYPGYHEGLKRELISCNVTGIVILCFSFSI